ncbi:MAG: hypothetical protein AABY00_01475 [Nanoarchaeota archaeon]
MSQSSTQEIGENFLKAFITQIIKNVKVESILFDKERLLKAVKRIEFEAFESPEEISDISDIKEKAYFFSDIDETQRLPENIESQEVPLLSIAPAPPEKKKVPYSPPTRQVPSSPSLQSSSLSKTSLHELLTTSSGKSLLDEKLPKFNKTLMIRRQIPRPPPTMLRVAVPKIVPPHPQTIKKPELSHPKSKEVHPSPPTLITVEALGKLNNLLLDPTVQTIECPGPGKQITVYRSGFIQNANIFLTTEEVRKIMAEISEKTKIPIIPGVFKAALGNFVITSVISEFVGTRFIIQKKEPSKLD